MDRGLRAPPRPLRADARPLRRLLGAVSGNWGKGKKPPKARELWNSRRKKPKRTEAEKVVDLEARRRMSEEFRRSGPPTNVMRRKD